MKQVSQGLNIQKEALAKRLGLPIEAGRNMSGLFEYQPAQVIGRIES
jgi:hypothetical protein